MEIARHPIGAAEENFRLATIFKTEDAAVFEEAADNAAHTNAAADAANAGAQRADAAHEEIDFDSGLRSAIERLNHVFIEERIHLGDNARGTALAGVFGLAIDERHAAPGEIERGDHQRAVAGVLGVSGQEAENILYGAGNFWIGGQEAEVGVEASGGGVVVAGAEMGVAARDAVGIAADEQGEFAVGFEADEAVKDLDAGVFEIARPADVRGFVEASFELDDGGDFFSRSGGDEGRHDERVLAGAVEGLLDRENIVVFGGGLNKGDHRIVGIEGMVEKDIVTAELFE